MNNGQCGNVCEVCVICKKGAYSKVDIITPCQVKKIINDAFLIFHPGYHLFSASGLYRHGCKLREAGKKFCEHYLPPFDNFQAPTLEELLV